MGIGVIIGILIVIFLAIIIGIIIGVIRYTKDDENEDKTFGINFLSKYCDNIFYGVETNSVTGKNGRKIITLEQRDIQSKNINNIKEISVIVEPNKIIHLAKGSPSGEKFINIYLPPSASDFPESIKSTELGKALMMVTEMKNAVNSELESVREGSKRKTEILTRLGDGELSRANLITIQELQKDIVKMVADVRKDRTPASPYPSVHSSSNS